MYSKVLDFIQQHFHQYERRWARWDVINIIDVISSKLQLKTVFWESGVRRSVLLENAQFVVKHALHIKTVRIYLSKFKTLGRFENRKILHVWSSQCCLKRTIFRDFVVILAKTHDCFVIYALPKNNFKAHFYAIIPVESSNKVDSYNSK